MLNDHDFDSTLRDVVGLALSMVNDLQEDLDPFVCLVSRSAAGAVEKTVVFLTIFPDSQDDELREFRKMGTAFQSFPHSIMAAYLVAEVVRDRDGAAVERVGEYPTDLVVVAGRTIDRRYNGAVLRPRLDPLGRVVRLEDPRYCLCTGPEGEPPRALQLDAFFDGYTSIQIQGRARHALDA